MSQEEFSRSIGEYLLELCNGDEERVRNTLPIIERLIKEDSHLTQEEFIKKWKGDVTHE
jgi:replication-associated recombination protein RarA